MGVNTEMFAEGLDRIGRALALSRQGGLASIA
jgi:hypothetical protein